MIKSFVSWLRFTWLTLYSEYIPVHISTIKLIAVSWINWISEWFWIAVFAIDDHFKALFVKRKAAQSIKVTKNENDYTIFIIEVYRKWNTNRSLRWLTHLALIYGESYLSYSNILIRIYSKTMSIKSVKKLLKEKDDDLTISYARN